MPKAVFILFFCLLLPLGNAQSPSHVPLLIKHSGVLKDRLSNPVHDIVGLTFLIYKDREGGTPLWMETQLASSLSRTEVIPRPWVRRRTCLWT